MKKTIFLLFLVIGFQSHAQTEKEKIIISLIADKEYFDLVAENDLDEISFVIMNIQDIQRLTKKTLAEYEENKKVFNKKERNKIVDYLEAFQEIKDIGTTITASYSRNSYKENILKMQAVFENSLNEIIKNHIKPENLTEVKLLVKLKIINNKAPFFIKSEGINIYRKELINTVEKLIEEYNVEGLKDYLIVIEEDFKGQKNDKKTEQALEKTQSYYNDNIKKHVNKRLQNIIAE